MNSHSNLSHAEEIEVKTRAGNLSHGKRGVIAPVWLFCKGKGLLKLAMKAQRGGGGVLVKLYSVFYPGARWGWVVNVTP
jgi:hypothetical protein